jgi:hypothetical protein
MTTNRLLNLALIVDVILSEGGAPARFRIRGPRQARFWLAGVVERGKPESKDPFGLNDADHWQPATFPTPAPLPLTPYPRPASLS